MNIFLEFDIFFGYLSFEELLGMEMLVLIPEEWEPLTTAGEAFPHGSDNPDDTYNQRLHNKS